MDFDSGLNAFTIVELESGLSAPPRKGDIHDLLAVYRAVRIRAHLSGAGAVAAHPGLLPKLRGAFGSVLLSSSCEGAGRGQCRCRPACAAAVFFGPKPRACVSGISMELSKPHVIAASRHGSRDINLELTVFGHAAVYAGSVRHAWCEAAAQLVPWRLLAKDCAVTFPQSEPALARSAVAVLGGLKAGPPPGMASIRFHSGLELNNRAELAVGGSDIFRRLTARAALVSPWFGLSLVQNIPALYENWNRINLRVEDAVRMPDQPRASSRTGQHWESRIVCTVVTLEGDLREIWPYLVLGEAIHIGRGAVSGAGKYQLSLHTACIAE